MTKRGQILILTLRSPLSDAVHTQRTGKVGGRGGGRELNTSLEVIKLSGVVFFIFPSLKCLN